MPLGNFERGIEDIFTTTSSAAKKTVSDTAKSTVSQITGSAPSSPASGETAALETNSANTSQNQNSNDPLSSGQTNNSAVEDQSKLAETRKKLHDWQSQNMKTYVIPTFETKPKQIAQVREKSYQESQKKEEQEKKQMELMQEEKKKEYDQIALNQKAKGEIGKVGSG